eukprot:7149895-Prorocentrum_lima.AAC.1
MARNLRGMCGTYSKHPINLPGYLKKTPCLLQATQVWDAFNGENPKEKKDILKAKISAMGLKS